jgi:hypothetical protein
MMGIRFTIISAGMVELKSLGFLSAIINDFLKSLKLVILA